MKFTGNYELVFDEYRSRKIDVSFPGDEPARFQIPKLYMPFGLSGFEADYGPKKWNVDFALKGVDEEGGQTKKFYDFIRKIESDVIDRVWSNSQTIFGRSMPRESVEGMFNSNIKQSGNYEPKFRAKVDVESGTNAIKPKIFDSNGVELGDVASEKLHSRQTGIAIVEMCSIYFMNKMFGITWKLHQLKVYDVAPKKENTKISWADEDGDDELPRMMTGFGFQSTS